MLPMRTSLPPLPGANCQTSLPAVSMVPTQLPPGVKPPDGAC